LALFGSVSRDDFGPESDVDVRISFADKVPWSLWDLTKMEDELSALVSRKIDLVEKEGLVELCQRQPYADAYLMVQDDVQFCRNLRTYLEQTLLPAEKLGVVTLYNPVTRAGQAPGFFDLASPDGLPGALALVLPNYAARLVIGDPCVLAHRRRGATHGTRLIDGVVGQWAARSGLSAVGHFPSLTQHVGDRTTIWGTAKDAAPRRSPPSWDQLLTLFRCWRRRWKPKLTKGEVRDVTLRLSWATDSESLQVIVCGDHP